MNATVRTRLSPAGRKKQLLDTAKAMIVEEGLQRFTMEALACTAGLPRRWFITIFQLDRHC
jgi:AcrR family transcriptional regulator